jgi:putative addiction module killer protein
VESVEQELVLYRDLHGKEYFGEWLGELPKKEIAVVLDRLKRVKLGNFGDWKPIKGTPGLFELRFHLKQGLRVFYGRDGNKTVVILNGSEKGDQENAIHLAERLWNEYQERKQ